METIETSGHKYSWLAIAAMIGVPALMYLFAAEQSTDMRESLNQGAAPNVAAVAMGGSLFLMRIGAMLAGALGVFSAVFGSPKETAPKWLVRR